LDDKSLCNENEFDQNEKENFIKQLPRGSDSNVRTIPKEFIRYLWRRWRNRLKYKEKIGLVKYVITRYEEITTISTIIDFGSNILYILAEKDANEDEIINLIEQNNLV
jgi:hypothetical protein